MRVSSRLLANERKTNCHFVSGFIGSLKVGVRHKTSA